MIELLRMLWRASLLCLLIVLANCASVPAPGDAGPSVSEAVPLADQPALAVERLPRLRAPLPNSAAAAGIRSNDLLERAIGALGVRYRYGGNTPETGFDCSGFVRWIYQDLAPLLPRSAQSLSQFDAPEIARDALQPGDLVFFRITRARAISHVGMYVGDGRFIHAPSRGGRVRVDVLDSPYWRARLVKSRRWIGLRAP